ncbi:MAG: GNAT family N-acetyltransferase, partial [Methanobacteriota archaeon]
GLAIGEKNHWKKGYGTEAVQLLLQEAFEQLNLHRLTWWTFAENEASLALAKKTGFREEGRTRDSVFFDNEYHDSVILGLLKEEYEARKHASPPPQSMFSASGRKGEGHDRRHN